jgi:hypothetical protein
MSAVRVDGPPRNGMPEFRPYKYRGTGADTLTPPELQALLDLEPDLPDALDELDAPVWPHGTYTGYGRHRSAGEQPCEPCRAAGNEYKRFHRKNAAPESADDMKPCGTSAAYRRHTRHSERVDEACRQANVRDTADRKARKRQELAA